VSSLVTKQLEIIRDRVGEEHMVSIGV